MWTVLSAHGDVVPGGEAISGPSEGPGISGILGKFLPDSSPDSGDLSLWHSHAAIPLSALSLSLGRQCALGREKALLLPSIWQVDVESNMPHMSFVPSPKGYLEAFGSFLDLEVCA